MLSKPIIRAGNKTTLRESQHYCNHSFIFSFYTTIAGDSFLKEGTSFQFSTYDHDNDLGTGNCAEENTGAWWYGACHMANLNGQYLHGQERPTHGQVRCSTAIIFPRYWFNFPQLYLNFPQLYLNFPQILV